MKNLKEQHLSLAVAMAALFVALGGSAYAVTKGSVTTKHVKDGTLSGKDVRDESLTGADVNESTLNISQPSTPAGPTGGPPSGPAGGVLSGQYPNPGLASSVVSSSTVADGSLGAADLASSSVTSSEIAFDAVDTSEIITSAVTDDELATDAVDSNEVENGALNGDDIGRASGTVAFDPPLVTGNQCNSATVNLGVAADLSADAFVVTVGTNWNTNLALTPGNAAGTGLLAVHLCNRNSISTDGPPTQLRWVAIDV